MNLCAENHVAGCTDVHRCTKIRLVEPLLILFSRCDSNDLPIGSGKDRGRLLRIAGGGDKDCTPCIRVINCVLNNERATLTAPTHIDDARAVVNGIDNRRGGVVILHPRTPTDRESSAYCHERTVPRHPGDTDSVIRHSPGDPGDVRPVSFLINRFVIAFKIIPLCL